MPRISGSKSLRLGMTRADVAKLTGLSPARITELTQQGLLRLIPVAGKPRHCWGVDPESAASLIARMGRTIATERTTPESGVVNNINELQPIASSQDHIAQQVEALVAALDRQLRYSTNLAWAKLPDEEQVNDLMRDIVREYLKRWEQQGGAPGDRLSEGA
jgi:hypothetical protein